jgi:S-adenosylmethionine/arginine decarboxylase-like enzyme
MQNKGNHIFLDIENVMCDDPAKLGKFIFELMQKSIGLTNMNIVHKHLEILQEPMTQNGFTSVLLLDASHMTSHCYSDLGLLAFDIFTCGVTDVQVITDHLIIKLRDLYPNLKITSYSNNLRFLYS